MKRIPFLFLCLLPACSEPPHEQHAPEVHSSLAEEQTTLYREKGFLTIERMHLLEDGKTLLYVFTADRQDDSGNWPRYLSTEEGERLLAPGEEVDLQVTRSGPWAPQAETRRAETISIDRGDTTGYRVRFNGIVGPLFDAVESVAVSPDQQRVAYKARDGGDWCMVIDQSPGKKFDQVGSILVEKLGGYREINRMPAGDGENQWVTLRWQPTLGILQGGALFTAGGRHVIYIGGNHHTKETLHSFQESMVYQVVIDGKPGPELCGVGPIAVSADGQHIAYWGHVANSGETIIVDDDAGEYWTRASNPVWLDARRMVYFAERGAKLYRVVRTLR